MLEIIAWEFAFCFSSMNPSNMDGKKRNTIKVITNTMTEMIPKMM